MNFLNIRHLSISLLFTLLILTTIQGIKSLSTQPQNNGAVSHEQIDTTDEFNIGEAKELSDLYARYEQMQPEPEEKTSNAELDNKNAQPESTSSKINKVLKPNFKGLDDKHQVGLVAVFDKPSQFAVLQMVNYETGKSEFIKLSQGKKVGQFELKEFNGLSILLIGPESSIKLSLFKPNKIS